MSFSHQKFDNVVTKMKVLMSADMTYNVFGGTLSLTQSINLMSASNSLSVNHR